MEPGMREGPKSSKLTEAKELTLYHDLDRSKHEPQKRLLARRQGTNVFCSNFFYGTKWHFNNKWSYKSIFGSF